MNKCIACNKEFKELKEEWYICPECWEKTKKIVIAKVAFHKEIEETLKLLGVEPEAELVERIMEEKQYNSFNKNDEYLYDIVIEAGGANNPIYLYGLINREEFEIRCSEDVFFELISLGIADEKNMKVMTPKGMVGIVIEDGERRLGISHDLRKNHKNFCIELIRKITNK